MAAHRVFDRLSLVLVDRLGEAGRINLGRVSVDSASLRALKGGHTPAQPCRPRQAREQLHLAADAGVPLVVLLTSQTFRTGCCWRQ